MKSVDVASRRVFVMARSMQVHTGVFLDRREVDLQRRLVVVPREDVGIVEWFSLNWKIAAFELASKG